MKIIGIIKFLFNKSFTNWYILSCWDKNFWFSLHGLWINSVNEEKHCIAHSIFLKSINLFNSNINCKHSFIFILFGLSDVVLNNLVIKYYVLY